ncbi:glycoside hydrolase family 16 protein [Qipengyuania oceanensis]|nr:glycoside hydrolase family 16 protein [Qipengyuania oceanensis]
MKTVLTIMAASLASSACVTAPDGATDIAQANERRIIFADEFSGTALDCTKWNFEGREFWVNDEQQVYVDSPDTIFIADGLPGADGGALVLKPLYRPGEDPRSDRKADFISGRINSQGKFDFTHGRAEARIKMTDHVGVWPAFWLLGNDKWPDTGEIDIMEYVGEKDWVGVALHGPGYSGETPLVDKYIFPAGTDVTQWHDYAVEWTRDAIVFEIDGRPTYRVTRPMVEHYGRWSFDNPKYVILNYALGGAYPVKTNGIRKPYAGMPQGTVDAIKRGEAAMYVDWVRVSAPPAASD